MDTSKAITHVSLCAGYGGIDLGLRRVLPTLRTIAYSEREGFCCANLVSKVEAGLMDAAPIWTDVKTFPWSEFHGCVDILSGGYPCQPFSAAGKRLGAEDPRHLWPFIAAGIAAMRPSVCFFENVEGHISLGLPDVLQDLAGLGYRTTWCVASASECGAPHQRKRVFILAYDGNNAGAHFWSRLIDSRGGCTPEDISSQAANQQAWRGSNARRRQDASSDLGVSGSWSAELADSQCKGLEGFHYGHASAVTTQDVGADAWASGECHPWPSRPGEQQFAWEPPRVVVDTKSQRAGQRSELRSEECGSRGALPWGVEQSGEGRTMENPNELRLEEHGLLNTGLPVGSSGGSDEQTDRLSNATHLRLEEQSECGQQHQEDGSGPSNPSGVCPCEAQEGRPLEHASHWSNGEQPTEQQGRHSVGGSSEAGAMGNAAQLRRPGLCEDNETIIAEQLVEPADSSGWQTQSSLGRDADGLTHRLDDAVLHVSTDNRTDELRLLGNGVVPATAERAFRILVGELMEEAP